MWLMKSNHDVKTSGLPALLILLVIVKKTDDVTASNIRSRRTHYAIFSCHPAILSLMPTSTHTALLSHALIGYEERKQELTETIARIRATLDGKVPASPDPIPTPTPRRKRGTMSRASRKRMALMMKQRWAKAKKAGRKRLG